MSVLVADMYVSVVEFIYSVVVSYVLLPSAQLRCCAGSWRNGRPAGSLVRLRTLATRARRTRRPRCSPPTSSPRPAGPCGASRSHTWWTCPRRTSASPRTPRPPMLSRGQTQTPWWLVREKQAEREKKKKTEIFNLSRSQCRSHVQMVLALFCYHTLH